MLQSLPLDDNCRQTTAPLRDRCRGALLGLAIGDALGTTPEFKTPGSFTPITDIVRGGPFRLARGHEFAVAGRGEFGADLD